jgi:hypothetical protein
MHAIFIPSLDLAIQMIAVFFRKGYSLFGAVQYRRLKSSMAACVPEFQPEGAFNVSSVVNINRCSLCHAELTE